MKKTVILSFIVILSAVFVAATSAGKPKPKPKKVKATKKEVPAATAAVADKITWYSPSEGYAKAAKEKKIVVVDVYTDWCYWCKVMDKETYENADIIKKMNQYFVAVKFNPEKNGVHKVNGQDMSSAAFLQYLNKGGQNSGYPTTFFHKKLDDNTGIASYPGYREVAGFNEILNTWITK
jgi:thioredoxin-related protein